MRSQLVLRAVMLVVLLTGLLAVSGGVAEAATPWWQVMTSARPTHLVPGEQGTIVARATNFGDGATSGPVTIKDRLPAGLHPESVALYAFSFEKGKTSMVPLFLECDTSGQEVTCEYPEFVFGTVPLPAVRPYEYIEVVIKVAVESSATTGESQVEVTGGGAASVSKKHQLVVGGGPAPFGIGEFGIVPEEEGGGIDARAGSHPFQLTTSFALNTGPETGTTGARIASQPALPKDFEFKLPAGLVGNAQAAPQCKIADFQKIQTQGLTDLCPADTAIGVAVVTVDEPKNVGLATLPVPVFNLVPEKGEPARFGFEPAKVPVVLDTGVRTGSDYGVNVTVSNVSEIAVLLSSQVTFWGVPGDARHDKSRGWECIAGGDFIEGSTFQVLDESNPRPFLTLPTSCGATLPIGIDGHSWPSKADPTGISVSDDMDIEDFSSNALKLTGCNQLPFSPSLEFTPASHAASTPTGLTANIHVPQEVNENASGLASSNIKDISVSLPDGLTLNPASAGGLEACSEAETGFIGFEQFPSEPGTNAPTFGPTISSPFCPTASKVGTAKIKSPLLPNPLEGGVYLATQNANPFGSLVALYIAPEDPVSGVVVKLPGEVALNSTTGAITTIFRSNPQVPFEDAELRFFGGNRAALSTPTRCGNYTATASFVPWSGAALVGSSASFSVNSGCPGGTLPFAPSMVAGTSNATAGAFSPLNTTISREDGSQLLQTVQVHTPPGLSGVLTGIPLCPQPQADAGTCGSQSLIGHASSSVGVGSEPFNVTGGQ